MNRPSRTDEPADAGYNQSPRHLSNDLTTNQDLNGISNARELRRELPLAMQEDHAGDGSIQGPAQDQPGDPDGLAVRGGEGGRGERGGEEGEDFHGRVGASHHVAAVAEASTAKARDVGSTAPAADSAPSPGLPPVHAGPGDPPPGPGRDPSTTTISRRIGQILATFAKFIGPGFMVAVAYIDPGNYATDVAAGASYQFRLLFIVLMSNLFAIFLQSLAIKLGTISGLNLAEACRAFLPPWLNIALYILAECAIIATDIAEVIGTAIALNLLNPKIPLVAGCAISIVDVLIILVFYQPRGGMRGLRAFEVFVMLLVLGVVACFCVELSMIQGITAGEVFHGYLPSHTLVEQKALYQACGILGATVMPHSLYLGSGIVHPRLEEYDIKRGHFPPPARRLSTASSVIEERLTAPPPRRAGAWQADDDDKAVYVPSLPAIRHCLKYSIVELTLSLFTFALFVNSAILIVAGASLYTGSPDSAAADANLFGIHDLLASSIAPAAGTAFALALLLSGVSAGIVCTIAGQMLSEGALRWRLQPWLRRLLTRSISITPSIIIAGAVGRDGLDAALNASQVALSIVLPFVTAPLIYFTCVNKYMTIQPGRARYGMRMPRDDEEEDGGAARAGAGATAAGDGAPGAGAEQHEQAAESPVVTGRRGLLRWRKMSTLQRRARGFAHNIFKTRRTHTLVTPAPTSPQSPTNQNHNDGDMAPVKMANHWLVAGFGIVVWLVITGMNVANLVLLGRG